VFWTVLRFELAYHRRRPSTYLFFVTLFLLTYFAMASDAFMLFDSQGQVKKNAPIVLAQTMSVICALGQTITTALMGTAILRDVQLKSHELLFTTRVTRNGYLGGRFVGAFLVMLFVYCALPLGSWIGTLMPWVDHDRLQPFRLMSYVQPFLIIVVPNILFVSALFFAIGAITRNLLAIYVQGVALFAVWGVSQSILSDLDKLQLAALVDPFALTTTSIATRYWTVAEKNSRLLTLTGPVLWNRVLWLGIAAAILAFAFAFVRLEVESRSLIPGWWRRRRARVSAEPLGAPPPVTAAPASVRLPVVGLHFDGRARLGQLVGLARFFFVSIVREPVFLAISIIALVNVGLGAWYADRLYGTPIWPVTAEMVRSLTGGVFLFIILLTTIYAGELVWRERQLRADGATDSLPVPTTVVLGGKLLGFLAAMAVMLAVVLLATVGVQTLKGYHHYEFALYAQVLLGIVWPTTVQLTLLALLVHTVVNNKYVGHVVMIVFYVLTAVLASWGFERVLYQYGQPPTFIYSDMNRFGQYASFLTWIIVYNSAIALVLLVIAYLFWMRGSDDGWPARLREAGARWRARSTRLVGGVTAAGAVAAGGFVFYNTAILNAFASTKDIERRRVAYEQTYRRFKDLAQPRIVGVRIRADLVPERRAFALRSVYRIVNKHARPIDSLFVDLAAAAFGGNIGGSVWSASGYRIDSLVWSRPTRVLFADSARGVYLYRLTTPLAPGDSITLAFGGHFSATGFPNANPNNDIVANGTFLNNSYFPRLGYDDNPELSDDDKRREYKLGPKARAPSIRDTAARENNALSGDADWITFDADVSTAPDQIAIAPGYLQHDSIENGRRVFVYHMDVPILNFYSIQSARYAVRHDHYKGVAIDVYYHPGHEYDIDRMIAATKLGLDYYTTNFSPYQFRQYRIIEFPRYQTFAQSFPNTVPYSEGIGFVARVRERDDDLDTPLFVTAHELAHQWWGHQVIPANVQGASMLVESMAEYSALTVMEHKYGASHAQKFLRYELDMYLRGRSAEKKKEMPLMLVENQPYIHYNKGSLAFYALRDYIGEDSLNAALRRFVRDKAFQKPPYTTSIEMLQYIRAVTPDSLQYVIHDLFETITLYDNKADTATATKRADGSYAVHLAFSAKKLRADSLGNQTEIPVADYIDVGVFGAPEPGNTLGKPLAVRKVHVTGDRMAVDFVVPERPFKAGVDPYNKLIDRTPEDNVRSVVVSG
jgi:ABC-type transport system involved in multi-copper enzyme maturation permease subunit